MKKSIFIILIILGLIGLIVGGYFVSKLIPNQLIVNGKTVQYAIPHMASYRCEPVDDKYGLQNAIPSNGLLLSKSTVGFYTNGISNIKTEVEYGFWTSLIKDLRLRYKICDANGNNCGSETIVKYIAPGTRYAVLNSVDFTKESLRVYFEQLTLINYILGKWTPYEGATISYDGKAFGLRLYSTTKDPAGTKICSTSCNLDCPDIGYRQKLVLTDKTQLGFYETAPYLEYWETIDYDLNEQGGATIYNSATNKFCFAGAIYTGSQMTLENGVTYIYPETNTRQVKACCPGAAISSTYSDLVCQNDYTWKIVQDTDKLTCISDYNCPNQGGVTCQNKLLSGYHCTDKDSNNVGICKKESSTSVECCINSDCNRDMVCDTSTHTCKGGSSFPVCGNKIKEVGEECDDGNTVGGDGCSSVCTSEGCPEGTILCDNGKCEKECTDGTCKGTWYYLYLDKIWCLINNFLYTFKLVFSIVLGLISAFFGWIYSSKIVKYYKLNKKIIIYLPLVFGLIIGALFGLIAFYYFWLIVIVLVILALIKIFI
jgi:cysteine-rich repeat protein